MADLNLNENNGEELIYQKGYVNSYIDAIIKDLPKNIVNVMNELSENKIEGETNAIIYEYLIEFNSIKGATFASAKQITNEEMGKLRKRKKYKYDSMYKEFNKDYEAVMQGQKVNKTTSPYSYLLLKTLIENGEDQSELIQRIKNEIDTWYSKVSDRKKYTDDISQYTGFIDFKYFYLYSESNRAEALKMARMDLEYYIFSLSQLEKYKNFYDIVPLRNTGLFSLKPVGRPKIKAEPEINIVKFIDGEYMTSMMLDFSEFRIINYISTLAVALGLNGKDEISGNLVDLCRICYPNRTGNSFSKRDYENVLGKLKRLKDVRFDKVNFNNNGEYETIDRSIVLFDEIMIPSSINNLDEVGENGEIKRASKGNEYVFRVRLGSTITKAIISTNLLPVLNAPLNALSDGVSKLIYMNICQDRIDDLTRKRSLIHIYTLIDMQFMVKISEGKKKRVKIYKEALEELKNQNILLDNVEWIESKNEFRVQWIPLSEIEKRDITLIGTSHNAMAKQLLTQNDIE